MPDTATQTETLHLTVDGREIEARPGQTVLAGVPRGGHPHPDAVRRPAPRALRWLPALHRRDRGHARLPHVVHDEGRRRDAGRHHERHALPATPHARRTAPLGSQGRVPHVRVERPVRAPGPRLRVRGRHAEVRAASGTPSPTPTTTRSSPATSRSASCAAAASASAPRSRAATCMAASTGGSTPSRRPPSALSMKEAGCEFCGQCVSTCPVGAITDKLVRFKGRPWELEHVETTCGYCGVGCTIDFHVHKGRVVGASAPLEKGVNKGNLCAKGRYGWGFANDPRRLTTPLIRKGAREARHASWARRSSPPPGTMPSTSSRSSSRPSCRSTAPTRSRAWPRRSARTRRTTCSRSSCAP